MNQNTTIVKKYLRGAFWRIAKPYSGAAPRGEIGAKLVRGLRFSKLTAFANKI